MFFVQFAYFLITLANSVLSACFPPLKNESNLMMSLRHVCVCVCLVSFPLKFNP